MKEGALKIGTKDRAAIILKHIPIVEEVKDPPQKIAVVKIKPHEKDPRKVKMGFEITYGDTEDKVWNWATAKTPVREIELYGKKYLLRGDWHPRAHVELELNKGLFEVPDDERIEKILSVDEAVLSGKSENTDISKEDIEKRGSRFKITYIGIGPHYTIGTPKKQISKNKQPIANYNGAEFQRAVPRIVELRHKGVHDSEPAAASIMSARLFQKGNAKHYKKIPETIPEIPHIDQVADIALSAIRKPKNVELNALGYISNALDKIEERIGTLQRKKAQLEKNGASSDEIKEISRKIDDLKKAKRLVEEFAKYVLAYSKVHEAYGKTAYEKQKHRITEDMFSLDMMAPLLDPSTTEIPKSKEKIERILTKSEYRHIIRLLFGKQDEYVEDAWKYLQKDMSYPLEVKNIKIHDNTQQWYITDSKGRKHKVISQNGKLIILPVKKAKNGRYKEIHGGYAIVIDTNKYETLVGTYNAQRKEIVGAVRADKLHAHAQKKLATDYGYTHEITQQAAQVSRILAKDYLRTYVKRILKLAKASESRTPKNYEKLLKTAIRDQYYHLRSPAHILAAAMDMVAEGHDRLAFEKAKKSGDIQKAMEIIAKSEFSKAISNTEINNLNNAIFGIAEILSKNYKNIGKEIRVPTDVEDIQGLLERIKSVDLGKMELKDSIKKQIVDNVMNRLEREDITGIRQEQIEQTVDKISEDFPERFTKVFAQMPPVARGKLIGASQYAAEKAEEETIGKFNYYQQIVQPLARIALHEGNLLEDFMRLVQERKVQKQKGDNGGIIAPPEA